VLGASLAAAQAAQTVRVGTSAELARALGEARPGTTILVAPGKYRGGLSARLSGTKEEPIVVAGADAKDPPVIEGGGGGLHFRSPAHVELRDLVVAGATGNGINIDDGGSVDTPAQHVLLKGVVVRDVGPNGNRDGIKLSGLNDFRVEGCRVERWGSGGSAIDMVGCQRGVIAGSTFIDARGDQANGVQAKGGSSDIVVQRCRFERAGGRAVNVGGSTGLDYFRPAVGDFEAKTITVEDCEFLLGGSAIAFVGVDGAIVRHNTIYRPGRWAIRILQENTDARFVPSRRGVFENNVVAFRAAEVREFVNIGPNTAPETFEFRGNVWHCLDRPDATQRLVRLPGKETGGIYDREPKFKDAEKGELVIVGRKAEDAGVRGEK
jgi:hypothetical protein